MWIFTKHGFISAVKHRDSDKMLIIRARKAEHLKALFPGAEIVHNGSADYKYRVFVGRDEFSVWLACQADEVDYPNFKNAIADHEYHDAAHDVWAAMRQIQPGTTEHLERRRAFGLHKL